MGLLQYYAVKRLNGDFGFEIDCESVGVECHVGMGNLIAKFRARSASRLISRLLGARIKLRNGHESADNDERDMAFSEWSTSVGVVHFFAWLFRFMHVAR
jgi:hypothetical protein